MRNKYHYITMYNFFNVLLNSILLILNCRVLYQCLLKVFFFFNLWLVSFPCEFFQLKYQGDGIFLKREGLFSLLLYFGQIHKVFTIITLIIFGRIQPQSFLVMWFSILEDFKLLSCYWFIKVFYFNLI